MNKDVIYIDVEDDITAIISKVKSSKEKIVALVPPKRIGVLQSAVNLRLLNRAAGQGDKRLVIITNNHALMSLASSAGLPVAKNLQSKPELAPIAAIEVDDDEDDVIDGNDLPVGDHARQSTTDDAVQAIAATPVISSAQFAPPPKPGEAAKKPGRSKSTKVPDFNTFRKKLVLGIVAGVLLIVFLVWAIVFAPRATIVVAAKTSDSSVNAKVSVGDKLMTSLEKNTLKASKVQKSEKKTLDFAATGTKNVGEKARGTVNFSTDSISVARNGATIPAGTALTSTSGVSFITDSSVTLTLANSEATATVTAAEQGAKYNAASGSLSGTPNGVSASLQSSTSGGTDRVVKVVTADDVRKAEEALKDEESKDVQAQLKSSAKNVKLIESSYRVSYEELKATPATGAESNSGNAVLSATVVYAMYGVDTNELGNYLDAYLKKQLDGDKKQRVYENGESKPEFQDVVNSKEGAELTLIATAKIGPRLEEDEIKQQSIGRKTGEIQEVLQTVQGIEQVEVNYFPFWVSSVPNDEKKVTVQFKVNE